MLGFKDFRCTRIILSGIEVMHMIRKGPPQVKKHVLVSRGASLLAGNVRSPDHIDQDRPHSLSSY